MSGRDCKNCKHHTENGCDSWDCEFEQRMTREDAIKQLKTDGCYECAYGCENVVDCTAKGCKYKEAFLMAINSLEIDERYELEYEQIEPCDDAISRQAVNTLVDELARAISDERCCMSRGRSTATIMQNILDLPPVNLQPKTGHWIWELEDWNKWTCSECGFSKRTDIHTKLGHKFCPNCGAKMEESKE